MGVIVLVHQSCMGLLVVFFCMYNGVIIVCTWAVIDYVYELSMNSGFIFWL